MYSKSKKQNLMVKEDFLLDESMKSYVYGHFDANHFQRLYQ